MTTYFISGHCDISEDEYLKYYQASIDKALEDPNSKFVVGDANGVDALTQKYLTGKTKNVTVYHLKDTPKNNYGNFNTIGNFQKHSEKDEAMTLNSDVDISWIRSIEEQKILYGDRYRYRKSGTQYNLERREKMNK
jgi:hypothetical protein